MGIWPFHSFRHQQTHCCLSLVQISGRADIFTTCAFLKDGLKLNHTRIMSPSDFQLQHGQASEVLPIMQQKCSNIVLTSSTVIVCLCRATQLNLHSVSCYYSDMFEIFRRHDTVVWIENRFLIYQNYFARRLIQTSYAFHAYVNVYLWGRCVCSLGTSHSCRSSGRVRIEVLCCVFKFCDFYCLLTKLLVAGLWIVA
jgi:hypothetical protein